MMFKNSFKLLCANFDKVWKLIVYQLLSWAIVLALLAPFYSTITGSLVEAWEANKLSDFFTSGTFYGLNVASTLTIFCKAILEFFSLLFTKSIFVGIYFVTILFGLKSIFANIGKFVVCEMMYGYMASSAKTSFTGSLLRTLKRSLPYACMKFLYEIPFNALIILSVFGLTYINDPLYNYFMPILLVLLPSLLLALKETFVAGWAPSMIVFDQNVFKAYPKGMIACFRRGARVFSTAFMMYLLAFVLSMVIGIYSLILILPSLFPLFDIFEMVMFFSSQGMRFYVDNDTVLTPKRLEEVDKIDKAKYLL